MSDRVGEIERAIAEGRMNAAQVFTQMLQLAQAARAHQPNLSRIAQNKLDQMGAAVHGVLVKNEAGAWAAVSDAGRVMWLDGFEGKSSAATPQTADNNKKLQALRDSINGDCYMGEEWELKTIDELLNPPTEGSE